MADTAYWRRYLRFLGSDPAADVDDELEFHLATRADDLVRAGATPEEARERAAREFGDVERIRAQMAEIGERRRRRGARARGREALGQDVRFAVRTLRRTPGFAATAVLTLALGIGAGTAMFGVLRGVLLRDLPVRAEEEVAVVWAASPASGHVPLRFQELDALRRQEGALAAVAGVAYQGALEQVLLDGGRPLTAGATWVTGGFFPLLGTRPLHGRALRPADDVPGAAPALVIGHALWRAHFGGDPAAVGRTLEWNGKRFTVVGVMPPGFEYPRGAQVWAPALPDFPATLDEGAHPAQALVFDAVVRLRPGTPPEAARGEVQAFLRATDARRPPPLRGMKPVVTPLAERVWGDVRPTLWAAAAAVALLLLVACVNVANLLLIRGAARSRELAVRAALGAGRGRLVRQLLAEAGVLAAAAGVLGVALAWAAVRALVALAPPELPRRETIALDPWVLLFALGATAAAALLAGVLPAAFSARGDLGTGLRGGRRVSGGGRGAQALRHGLVVGQVALALAVVAAAGVVVRSLVALGGAEMGFDADRVLLVQTTLPPDPAAGRARDAALLEEAVARVAALPGVAGAAALPRLPFSGESGWSAPFTGEGQAPEAQAENPLASFEVVGPGFFATLGIPLVRGRGFTGADREGAPRVAVVSEAVARRTWPGRDPVGRRIKLGPPGAPTEWHTVVGVAAETRFRELAAPHPTLYLPARQFDGPVPMALALRTRGDPAALVPRVAGALRAVHPELRIAGGGSVRQLMAGPLARPRFGTALLGAFAALTLLLAVVGVYGAMATTVRQRSHELGIRLALGAGAADVRRLVLRQGMRLAVWGCALGMAAALLGTRALRGMLFGVSPADPLTFAAVPAIVLAAAALACALPARRASRVDPVEVLRGE